MRYTLKEVIGRGGMGAVYRAYDNETHRDVTLKTLLDVSDRTMLDLFSKECQVLASLQHPNIVDIYDVGEMEIDGGRKPYFVMPYLQGVTLDKLIAAKLPRLPVGRLADILSQAARGLHAAHENNLVHRDIKPSNIFVLEDDSVKIIDFGVAHLAASRDSTTLKGTLHYMAPEQLRMQKPTALSDLFSLAVVSYQAFAGRRPFEGATMDETMQAILHRIPPPATELNPQVPAAVSQVIHKALAKEPWHRFASVREFGDSLMKAYRGEPIEHFDASRIVPRLEKARRALHAEELDFASEVLGGLEAEGHLHPEITELRRQVDEVARTRKTRQLLESARRFLSEQEYPLALQRVQELLESDPTNKQALEVRAEIESRRNDEQVTQWTRLASQHLESQSFSHARQAAQNALQLKPDDTSARKLLGDINAQEQEFARVRNQKDSEYQGAMEAYQRGDLTASLSRINRVLELERRMPDVAAPDRAAGYQRFQEQVKADLQGVDQAYQEAKAKAASRDWEGALAICTDVLNRYPANALFQALRVDTEEKQRLDLTSYITQIDRDVEAEPDLNKRIQILEKALEQRGKEQHFQRALDNTRAKRELVNSIVARARNYEERGQFADAVAQWETLRAIYPVYPELAGEIERLQSARDLRRIEEKRGEWIEQIDRSIALGEYAWAIESAQTALGEYPGDAELEALAARARSGADEVRDREARFARGRDLCQAGKLDEGIEDLRSAWNADQRNSIVRAALVDALIQRARELTDSDWKRADALATEALQLDPGNAVARSLEALLGDRRRSEFIDTAIAGARQSQAAGQVNEALDQVLGALDRYPGEPRLVQLRNSLERHYSEAMRTATRLRDLEKARTLADRSAKTTDPKILAELFDETLAVMKPYTGDREFEAYFGAVEKQVASTQSIPPPAPSPGKPSIAAATATPKPPAPPIAAPRHEPKVEPDKSFSPPASPPSPPKPVPPPIETRAPEPPKPQAPPEAKPKGKGKEKAAEPVPAAPSTFQIPSVPKTPPPAPAAQKKSPLPWILGGTAVAVLAAVAAFFVLRSGEPEAPPVATIAAQLLTEPAGATVNVDGKAVGVSPVSVSLPAGDHPVTITLEGYQPFMTTLNVSSGQPCCDPIKLTPLSTIVRISSDLKGGQASLDDQVKGAVPEGQALELLDVGAGDHKVGLASAEGSVEVVFKAASGSKPDFLAPANAKGVKVYILSAMGSRGRFFSSTAPVRLSWDGGRNFLDVGADGIELNGLEPGVREFIIEEAPGKQRRETIVLDAAPALNAFFYSGREPVSRGTIVIQVNEPGVEVLLDNRRISARSRSDGSVVVSAPPGKHTVEVRKAGFAVEPASAPVEVRDGQTVTASFRLSASPSQLSIRGSAPGVTLRAGGRTLGTTDATGSFTTTAVSAGAMTLELSKPGYRPKQIALSILAGAQVNLSGAEVTLERMEGRLRFKVTPARGVRLSIQQTEGVIRYTGPPQVDLPPQIVLPAGTYNLELTAPGYQPATINIPLTDGRDQMIETTLQKR